MRFEADVVSLDMFQTLVDLDTVTVPFWRNILDDEELESAIAVQHDQGMLACFFSEWAAHKEGSDFHLMRHVYDRAFQQYAGSAGLRLDHQSLVDVLFGWHREAEPYPDTLPFLDGLVQSGIPACIVSDADDAMLPERLLAAYPGIRVLTSEQHRTYKNDRRNGMFHELLAHYGVCADRVVHIGDSASDVLGARRAGMRTIWLNRNGRMWPNAEAVPDAEVQTLTAAAELLGIS